MSDEGRVDSFLGKPSTDSSAPEKDSDAVEKTGSKSGGEGTPQGQQKPERYFEQGRNAEIDRRQSVGFHDGSFAAQGRLPALRMKTSMTLRP